jgi:threonine/homoserine/homoserine lactone efflux protein
VNQLLAFLGVSLVVIIVPGPDTALTLRNTLRGGRAAGLASTLGIATGQVFWALATSLGIATLILASQPVFFAVKIAGAAYLVLLGALSIHAVLRGVVAAPDQPIPSTKVPQSAVRAYRQGVVSNLGNPKMAAFFTSLLPQFVPNHHTTFAMLFSLGVIFAVLTLSWLTLYVTVAGVFRRILSRARVRQWIEGVTGTVLIALGIRVAIESGP